MNKPQMNTDKLDMVDERIVYQNKNRSSAFICGESR